MSGAFVRSETCQLGAALRGLLSSLLLGHLLLLGYFLFLCCHDRSPPFKILFSFPYVYGYDVIFLFICETILFHTRVMFHTALLYSF